MLGGLDGERTVVRRLRLRGASAANSRSRLSQAVATATLRPPAFPTSAILCVRRLLDPAPGRLCGPLAVRPSAEWELAVRDRLGALWHAAARPAVGPVPPNAAAVWFASRAELLACLAADWRDGLLRSHWWWDGGDVLAATLGADGSAVLAAWMEHADDLPAALACLADSRRLVHVVAALPDGDAVAITIAVALRFSLPHPALSSESLDQSRTATDPERSLDKRTSIATRADIEPHWIASVPEARDPALSSAQRRLVVTGLLLQRAPAVIRDVSFMASLVGWNTAIERARGMDASHHAHADGAPSGGEADEPAAPIRDVGRSANGDPPTTCAAARGDGTQAAGPVLEVGTLGAPSPYGTTAPNSFAVQSAVHTGLGGVFYLVNVALALGLYGDFTTPAKPGLALSLWDFLAITGRDLSGDAFDSDPLAGLLARLANRCEHERAGSGFDPGIDWCVSAEWLESFPERGGWTWSAGSRRLVVHHPAGFVVADVARDVDSTGRAQVARIIETLGITHQAPSRRRHRRTEPGRLPVDRWTSRIMPYVRARLRRALGATGGDDLGAVVCARGARIHVSTSRVDVNLTLADLPIEVRLAGLDRNPGWVPSIGRTVAFHYE